MGPAGRVVVRQGLPGKSRLGFASRVGEWRARLGRAPAWFRGTRLGKAGADGFAGCGEARQRSGKPGLGRRGKASAGQARIGPPRLGTERCGLAGEDGASGARGRGARGVLAGQASRSKDALVASRCGLVSHGPAGEARWGRGWTWLRWAWQARRGTAGRGTPGRGTARCGRQVSSESGSARLGRRGPALRRRRAGRRGKACSWTGRTWEAGQASRREAMLGVVWRRAAG